MELVLGILSIIGLEIILLLFTRKGVPSHETDWQKKSRELRDGQAKKGSLGIKPD